MDDDSIGGRLDLNSNDDSTLALLFHIHNFIAR